VLFHSRHRPHLQRLPKAQKTLSCYRIAWVNTPRLVETAVVCRSEHPYPVSCCFLLAFPPLSPLTLLCAALNFFFFQGLLLFCTSPEGPWYLGNSTTPFRLLMGKRSHLLHRIPPCGEHTSQFFYPIALSPWPNFSIAIPQLMVQRFHSRTVLVSPLRLLGTLQLHVKVPYQRR
jgi:hypothetical protein